MSVCVYVLLAGTFCFPRARAHAVMCHSCCSPVSYTECVRACARTLAVVCSARMYLFVCAFMCCVRIEKSLMLIVHKHARSADTNAIKSSSVECIIYLITTKILSVYKKNGARWILNACH